MSAYRCGAWWCPTASEMFDTWTATRHIELSAETITSLEGSQGEATSPWLQPDFPPHELIVSWNSRTQGGGSLEILVQVRFDNYESRWLSMGLWSADPAVIRGSCPDKDEGECRVLTDTVVCKKAFSAFRVRAVLSGAAEITGMSATWSDPKATAAKGHPAYEILAVPSARITERIIEEVPTYSQMIYPNGGNTWCSPTSLAMVMEYWNRTDRGCADCVHEARAGVYDPVYKGHGNWAFNAAWAGECGFVARVLRFPDLRALEPWIDAGIPLVLSVAWNKQTGPMLSNAPVTKSNGHLNVLVGFDEHGNAVMNEPASPSNETVRRTYARQELEHCWLKASGGACYVVYPKNQATPPTDSPLGKALIIAS